MVEQNVSKGTAHLRELAESALRRPVHRDMGVLVTDVQAKGLAEGVIGLIEQLEALEGKYEALRVAVLADERDGTFPHQTSRAMYSTSSPASSPSDPLSSTSRGGRGSE